jgi:hypothetical protein
MVMKKIRAGLICCLTVTSTVFVKPLEAQGTFRNLDFELANVPTLPSGQYGSLNGVLVSEALPFWTAFYGSEQVSAVSHNSYSLGSANISILGPHWDNSLGTSIINGNYTAVLQAGDNPGPVSVSIAQTGTIPIDSQSILVNVKQFFAGSGLSVSLDGQNVPAFLVEHDAGYSLFGVDISSFAGQTTELRLTAETTPGGRFNSIEIDDVTFSNQPIPEPATSAIVLSGLALWFFGYRRSRS